MRYTESAESKRFWSQVFYEVFDDNASHLVWYENGHYMDVIRKVDVSVVLINSGRHINYQIKNRPTQLNELEVNFNIAKFDRYINQPNDIEFFGFGFLKNNTALIVYHKSIFNFWRTYRSKLVAHSKGVDKDAYVKIKAQTLADYTESMWVRI